VRIDVCVHSTAAQFPHLAAAGCQRIRRLQATAAFRTAAAAQRPPARTCCGGKPPPPATPASESRPEHQTTGVHRLHTPIGKRQARRSIFCDNTHSGCCQHQRWCDQGYLGHPKYYPKYYFGYRQHLWCNRGTVQHALYPSLMRRSFTAVLAARHRLPAALHCGESTAAVVFICATGYSPPELITTGGISTYYRLDGGTEHVRYASIQAA
jgi:hypothetical protein